jgi:AcrR family transcriptional regulator
VGRRSTAIDLDSVLAGMLHAGAGEGLDPAAEAAVQAASELIAARGLHRWSVDDAAERAGLGRATVYRRFPSREELVRAALRREADAFFAAVSAAVASEVTLEAKVLEGLVVSLALAGHSPLGRLLSRDPAAAGALLGSAELLQAATAALADSYRRLTGAPVDEVVAARAEALVRLGVSYLVAPAWAGDGESDPDGFAARLRRRLAPVVTALVAPGR